jgi:hypothetical protein
MLFWTVLRAFGDGANRSDIQPRIAHNGSYGTLYWERHINAQASWVRLMTQN